MDRKFEEEKLGLQMHIGSEKIILLAKAMKT
jgi:hypothetical protein